LNGDADTADTVNLLILQLVYNHIH